jgi:hypothetical protein
VILFTPDDIRQHVLGKREQPHYAAVVPVNMIVQERQRAQGNGYMAKTFKRTIKAGGFSIEVGVVLAFQRTGEQ